MAQANKQPTKFVVFVAIQKCFAIQKGLIARVISAFSYALMSQTKNSKEAMGKHDAF